MAIQIKLRGILFLDLRFRPNMYYYYQVLFEIWYFYKYRILSWKFTLRLTGYKQRIPCRSNQMNFSTKFHIFSFFDSAMKPNFKFGLEDWAFFNFPCYCLKKNLLFLLCYSLFLTWTRIVRWYPYVLLNKYLVKTN